MRKLHLSPAAVEDLENILQYTLDTWGGKQFALYFAAFQQAFDTILFNPETPLSVKREELFPDCQSICSGHHVVFFRRRNRNIEIVRVLHERMDFLKHFEEEEE
jgi:toxin ParE1/3/4